jgi:hypothetical protein
MSNKKKVDFACAAWIDDACTVLQTLGAEHGETAKQFSSRLVWFPEGRRT